MAAHSTYFYILIALMSIGVLQALSVGSLFFLKQSGHRLGNYFYGMLLLAIGLTLLHNIGVLFDFFDYYPRLKFLPIYYTLSLPVFLFFYVKLSLYPKYKLKWSDFKHFILPLGQFLYFVLMFFSPISYKSEVGRTFFNPFFGAFEQFLYLSSSFAYLYFSYRYIKRRKLSATTPIEFKQLFYIKNLIKIYLLAFIVHTGFVLSDFFVYELFQYNLQNIKPYAGLGAMSFVMMEFWLGTYGFQVVMWGRKVFGKK